MDDENKQLNSRNVTWKEAVVTILALSILLPLFWFVEAGNKWAGIAVAILPVIGYLYWLKIIPKENRQQAEEKINKTKLGKVLNYISWAAFILFCIVIFKIIVEVIISQ